MHIIGKRGRIWRGPICANLADGGQIAPAIARTRDIATVEFACGDLMAKYGLGQVDLNLLARLALRGISKTPERDIAILLESGQPIETETRMEIAAALLGRAPMPLTLKKGKHGTRYRSYRIRQKRLEIGRRIQELNSQDTRSAAQVAADEAGVSLKVAEIGHALANQLADWLTNVRADGNDWSRYDDGSLEIAFLFADVVGEDPMSFVRGNLEGLIQLLGSVNAAYRETRVS